MAIVAQITEPNPTWNWYNDKATTATSVTDETMHTVQLHPVPMGLTLTNNRFSSKRTIADSIRNVVTPLTSSIVAMNVPTVL